MSVGLNEPSLSNEESNETERELEKFFLMAEHNGTLIVTPDSESIPILISLLLDSHWKTRSLL